MNKSADRRVDRGIPVHATGLDQAQRMLMGSVLAGLAVHMAAQSRTR